MAYYKLLAGKHLISVDPFVRVEPGAIVEDTRNLVELFGESKFELVSEPEQDKASVVDAEIVDAAVAKTKTKKS